MVRLGWEVRGDSRSVVEQLAHNRLVAGSIPAGPTKSGHT